MAIFQLTKAAWKAVQPEVETYRLDPDAPNLVKFVCMKAREVFNGTGQHTPMILLWDGKTSTLNVVVVPFTDDRMKLFTAQIMREAAAQGKAEEIVLITEAWFTMHAVDDKTVGNIAPRDNPSRQECIIVEYSRPQIAWSAMATIDRPPQGAPRLLDWITINSETGTLTGRFSNVWKPNTTEATIEKLRGKS